MANLSFTTITPAEPGKAATLTVDVIGLLIVLDQLKVINDFDLKTIQFVNDGQSVFIPIDSEFSDQNNVDFITQRLKYREAVE